MNFSSMINEAIDTAAPLWSWFWNLMLDLFPTILYLVPVIAFILYKVASSLWSKFKKFDKVQSDWLLYGAVWLLIVEILCVIISYARIDKELDCRLLIRYGSSILAVLIMIALVIKIFKIYGIVTGIEAFIFMTIFSLIFRLAMPLIIFIGFFAMAPKSSSTRTVIRSNDSGYSPANDYDFENCYEKENYRYSDEGKRYWNIESKDYVKDDDGEWHKVWKDSDNNSYIDNDDEREYFRD